MNLFSFGEVTLPWLVQTSKHHDDDDESFVPQNKTLVKLKL